MLVGNINAGDFVTGVVVALLGHEDDSGKFIVEEVCPANMPIMVTPEKHHIDTTRLKIFYVPYVPTLLTLLVIFKVYCFHIWHRSRKWQRFPVTYSGNDVHVNGKNWDTTNSGNDV